jgi:hypothetical protein
MTASSSTPVAQKASRQRKDVVPPAVVTETMSVFDYLHECTPPLDKKIIDIACSQSLVPDELRKDASQEIALMWSQMTPDTARYKPGQIAAYAHQMARHAALRVRRELGASVRLPGSAFRKRKDGSSYVTPGVLSSALDWNELENWFQTDDLTEGGMSPHFGSDMPGMTSFMEEEATTADDEFSEEAMRTERLELVTSKSDVLTERQRAIIQALVEGAKFEEIMAEQNIKKGVLMRELAIASSFLGPLEY